ncbi:MAG: hypothetical protein COB02_00220 [Candidatus Cloacimonadota bacterium]|nr:MAG: hypothetical protein COB02_04355 [Candidatus Cloacimonadota bacterium]PCJ21048.1 MAG: hypothetical protein COB02_00220 [Candidatus Cloacimonadota bacterium]
MSESKKFTRINESFICENCKKDVLMSPGGKCRNHCTHCLYSLHIDINPGDRLSNCGGMLKPDFIEVKSNKNIIHHRCLKCDEIRPNKCAEDDDFGTILKIMQSSKLK